MTPLVNQLEVPEATPDLYRSKADKLGDCLVQLAVAVGTDVLWKPLNYQVLLRTRSDSPIVRYSALQIVEKLYERLGEEFVILVPETVPFLAELMEDSNLQVEQLSHKVIKTINSFLGDEKIEDYF
jgi:U3 small nucleolar RNA-associated protein 10